MLKGITVGCGFFGDIHLHLRLQDGVWAIIYMTRCSEPDAVDPVCDWARVEGNKGFIRLDRDGTLTVKPLFERAFEYRYEVPATGYRGDSCRAALQHFVDCMLSGECFETEGEEYLEQVMRAVFAGYRSTERRESVSLFHNPEATPQHQGSLA
jgi:predicted dehydrogenase